ncbi:hypothetical protein F6Y05_35360 [Bacillus megaterium]|nr:hypothetical protein [Priestia megaterium]
MSAKRKFKTEQDILDTLKVVIDKGEWKGVKHLQKNNNSLHNAIYKGMGYTKAFSRLDLNYEDYKGANRKWTEEKILRELKKWVALQEDGKVLGIYTKTIKIYMMLFIIT